MAGQDCDYPQSVSPETKRILRTAYFDPQSERHRKRVQLVCKGHDRGGASCGNLVSGASGHIMLGYRPDNERVQPLQAGIMTSHHSFKLGKLSHHCRQKVGFGQESCLFRGPRLCFRQFQDPGQKAGNLRHPLGLITHAPCVLDKADFLKTRNEVVEGDFAVLFKEKTCVFQPCAEHPLVPLPDRLNAGQRVAVTHAYEGGKQGAISSDNGEILLMVTHGRD